MKLYELTENYVQLLDLAEQLDEDTFRDTLESIQESIEDKAENTAKLIRSLEADTVVIREEEKRLAERRRMLEVKIDNIKDYLKEQLEKAGIDKVKRPLITVSIQNNPPRVEVTDDKKIPSAFMIPVAPKIDKKAIMKAIKDGQEVPGAEITQTRGLRIR